MEWNEEKKKYDISESEKLDIKRRTTGHE